MTHLSVRVPSNALSTLIALLSILCGVLSARGAAAAEIGTVFIKNYTDAPADVWLNGSYQGVVPAQSTRYTVNEGFVTRDSGRTATGELVNKESHAGWEGKGALKVLIVSTLPDGRVRWWDGQTAPTGPESLVWFGDGPEPSSLDKERSRQIEFGGARDRVAPKFTQNQTLQGTFENDKYRVIFADDAGTNVKFFQNGSELTATSRRVAGKLVLTLQKGSTKFELAGSLAQDGALVLEEGDRKLVLPRKTGQTRIAGGPNDSSGGLGTPVLMRSLSGHSEDTGWIMDVGFSLDGRFIVSSTYSEAIVWDVGTGERLRILAGKPSDYIWPHHAAFSPDGRSVVTQGRIGEAIIWDAASGQILRTLSGHYNNDDMPILTSVEFSPDGRFILLASLDGTVSVSDAVSGQRVHTLSQVNPGFSHDSSSCASYSRDGRLIVTANWYGLNAFVWDAASGKRLRTLFEQSQVQCADFSPDGRFIVTGLVDGNATVWDAASGQRLRTLAGHSEWVLSAAFSPDGRFIVTGSRDNTAIIWDTASGQRLHTLPDQGGDVYCVEFSPDGRLFVTGLDGGTVKVWQVAR